MEMPKIKRCNNCGAFCESTIDPCPGHKRGSLDLCKSSDFRPITPAELEGIIEGKLWVHFKKWPILPNEDVWHEIRSKGDLEKPHLK
jgi:hypothetical protein